MVKVFPELFPAKTQGTHTPGYYMDGKLKENLDITKKAIREDWDMCFLVDGAERCLDGDTQIQVSRLKVSRRYSIKRLYNQYHGNPQKVPHFKPFDLSIPNFVRSYNGEEIRLNKIKDVTYSGKREVFRLTLDTGKTIISSNEHKYLTRDGWKELQHIRLGFDELMCDKLKPEKSGRRRVKLYDITPKVYYHPYSKDKRVAVHKLIYESYINNLSFLDYMDILLNEEEKAKTLKFIDPNIYHIHHRDGCHYNNSINNLMLIKKEDHLKYHSKDQYRNFSQGQPIFSKAKSIEYVGERDTYDIVCQEPHHNFVANGIVVHNSGKSLIAQQIAFYCDPTLTAERIVFRPEEFRRAVLNANRYEAIVFDEAFSGFSSAKFFTDVNQVLVEMMAEIGQKNLFVIIVMPTFFDVMRYIALWRSRMLIHVYADKFQRGYFKFYNYIKKKNLYVLGKKIYSYKVEKEDFYGRFTNFYTVDKQAYLKKKYQSLKSYEPMEDIQKRKVAEITKTIQKRITENLYLKRDKFSIKMKEISEVIGITERTMGNYLKDIKELEKKIENDIIHKKRVTSIVNAKEKAES